MLAQRVATGQAGNVKRDVSSSRSKVGIATAAAALVSIGTLAGLTVTGILSWCRGAENGTDEWPSVSRVNRDGGILGHGFEEIDHVIV